ncbi:MAG TPA: hypothetical protein VNW92_10395 [Polyangiaceae bacterium]|jgi:hypothetical protein|nr:hypothetical protein [Polyangiaceae bacterium]
MASPSLVSTRLFALALAGCAFSLSARAHADTSIIRHAGDHSRYSFEAEPHLLLGLFNPPGPAYGTGFGVGFRGTVIVLDNGFVPTINNSIGIGFGADWVHYGSGGRPICVTDTGPSQVPTCNTDSVSELWFPVVMQWNFFLSRQWSVFGEPGLALRYQSVPGVRDLNLDPQLYVGGRWHFSDQMTLTMRLGYPTFSVGVSFM